MLDQGKWPESGSRREHSSKTHTNEMCVDNNKEAAVDMVWAEVPTWECGLHKGLSEFPCVFSPQQEETCFRISNEGEQDKTGTSWTRIRI